MEPLGPQTNDIALLMTKQTKIEHARRRAELLAELFLQELEPRFVAQATVSDFLYDFFVGFQNPRGGMNTFAVEVKSTERPVNGEFKIPAKVHNLLANSNIPVLLLVIDVKENQLYYAWPCDHPDVSSLNETIDIPVIHVDPETKRELIDRMTA